MTYVTGTNPKNQIYHVTYNYSQVNAAAYGICSCASVACMRFFLQEGKRRVRGKTLCIG